MNRYSLFDPRPPRPRHPLAKGQVWKNKYGNSHAYCITKFDDIMAIVSGPSFEGRILIEHLYENYELVGS